MAQDIANNARDYVLLAEPKKTEALQLANDTASKVEAGKVTLFEVVQSLGEYINHDDAAIRAKATDYFSQVINGLAPDCLLTRHAQVVCTFLCSRMEDGGAISGVAALQRQKVFNSEMAVMTLKAMIACSAELRQRPQDRRFQAVQVLHALMASHRPALKALGVESATGIVEIVNGEKDPRNLMIIFSILEVVIAEWDVAPLSEALFDSVFCYFPITFRPPPGDPYGITAADLKARLRDCVAASSFLAPHAFAQLVDKLDSSSANVKRDVLDALRACAERYDPATLSSYAVFLWDSLKYEAFNAQEDDLAVDTLLVVRALAAHLRDDGDGVDASGSASGLLKLVARECTDRLREPQQKVAKAAGQVLRTVVGISPEAFACVVAAAVPRLIKQYQTAGSIEERLALLEPLSEILCSAPSNYAGPSQSMLAHHPLVQSKADMLQLCTSTLGNPSREVAFLRVTALKCLSSMIELPGLLTAAEVKTVVQELNSIILRHNDDPETSLKDEAIQCLRTVSKALPDLIVNETFPVLIARLFTEGASLDFGNYCANLECLARISTGTKFCGTLVRRLIGCLDDAVSRDDPVQNVSAMLSTINYVLVEERDGDNLRPAEYHQRLLQLITAASNAAVGKQDLTPLNQPDALLSLGRLALTIVHDIDAALQQEIVAQAYTLQQQEPVFINGPTSTDISEPRGLTVMLSTYLLAAAESKNVAPRAQDEWQTLFASLIQFTRQQLNPLIRQGLLQHLSLIVSKFLPDNDLGMAALIFAELRAQLHGNSIRIMFALARALLWRLYEVHSILDQLLTLVENPAMGLEAARGFELLFAPDEIVSESNGAQIKPFAKQRIFGLCLPIIASKVRGAQPSKENYLFALSGMLKHIDSSLLVSEADVLLPPLLQILDLDFADAKNSAIQVIMAILQDDTATVEEHALSLVNRLLKLAVDGQNSEVDLRRKALALLALLPSKLKGTIILPLRHTVTRKLLAALDDRRRLVRKAAVDCRAVWLGLENPEDEA